MVEVSSESLECKVSAKRMWEGLIKDAHNCLPKALSHKVLGIEYPLGQHGFSLPGAVRVIKYYKVIEDDLLKAEAATKKFLHERAAHAKTGLEKVAHKEAALMKEKMKKLMEEGIVKETHFIEKEMGKETHFIEKEMVGGDGSAIHKAIKVLNKEGEMEGGAVHKDAALMKEKMKKVEEGVVKETHVIEKEMGKETHFVEKEIVGGGGGGGATDKAIKVLHKEGGAVHKVGELVELEVMEVKEKIEEIDHEAFKITVAVIGGGLLGILFLHYKHSFQIQDAKEGGSCMLHWTSEFEALSKSLLSLEDLEDHKKHVLDTFHCVEAYLLKHDDYAH